MFGNPISPTKNPYNGSLNSKAQSNYPTLKGEQNKPGRWQHRGQCAPGLPGDIRSVEGLVFPVGRVSFPVDAEWPVGGGLEVVQPDEAPRNALLLLLPERQNHKVTKNITYGIPKCALLMMNIKLW